MMHHHFCTLFDRNYLSKGLALHASLVRHSSEPFTLHILAMDMETFWLLSEMNLANVEVIPLEAFESALKLEPVKQSRSWAEYCWTCASSLMEYLLPWHDAITYLDADVFFYSDPNVIFDEIGESSIGIVPHRFNERERKRLGQNGEYNVGVVYARSSTVGLRCINRWASQTRDWCFNRNESGKFGDQAYLDSWPTDYPGEVCVIQNLGVNLGPWAVGNFVIQLSASGNVFVCGELVDRLVCYHFHEYAHGHHLTHWPLRDCDRGLVYRPYIVAISEQEERIRVARAQVGSRRDQLQEQGARA